MDQWLQLAVLVLQLSAAAPLPRHVYVIEVDLTAAQAAGSAEDVAVAFGDIIKASLPPSFEIRTAPLKTGKNKCVSGVSCDIVTLKQHVAPENDRMIELLLTIASASPTNEHPKEYPKYCQRGDNSRRVWIDCRSIMRTFANFGGHHTWHGAN